MNRDIGADRWKIKIAYDGTNFHGWQRQNEFRTVQGEIENAILPLSHGRELVPVYGSGRTDAGVHAHGQIAHFDLKREITPVKLYRAINGNLRKNDVKVMSAEKVDSQFDARRSAVSKEYRYRIWNAEIMEPLERLTHTHVSKPIDIDAMRTASAYFIGTHDFAAFSANPLREIESTVRTVNFIDIISTPPRLEIRVNGNGFLYKMVRSIAGFLISVGTGREKPEAVTEIMNSRIRTARVESAQPQGLTLWQVNY
ncbi:MAG: tRNA pseudouridine(38-40) synthase TruA [Lentisphaerae bacterium]|jgi:tRNA pseudouridine38-40 synthase|nr:tRNA pseudouridine(38-40) synthase TruA [Lentisphaerota bacterium]